ncbi:MAG: hypothetical protein FWE24_09085 [Defluviitaleaceae bacterium]|nr:hypothetical protein [Defluviitaleaceae bacterium]
MARYGCKCGNVMSTVDVFRCIKCERLYVFKEGELIKCYVLHDNKKLI